MEKNQGHHKLDRSFFHLLAGVNFVFSPPLKRSQSVQTAFACTSSVAAVWLAQDQALREHAAAIPLVEWASINIQVYNSHAAEAAARSVNGQPEPLGSSTLTIICKSWNRGKCASPVTVAVLGTTDILLAQAVLASQVSSESRPHSSSQPR